jgi:uncharacterized membrane protein YphA (DoxX/SURF4 family)
VPILSIHLKQIMRITSERSHTCLTDAGLLYLRVTGSVLVLVIHGLPKAMHFTSQAAVIEDPLHIGKTLTLWFAIFGEVFCPLLMIAGIATRVAALPILLITAMALRWCIVSGRSNRGSSPGCYSSYSEPLRLLARDTIGSPRFLHPGLQEATPDVRATCVIVRSPYQWFPAQWQCLVRA